jgi:hypothetical protein
MFEEIRKIVEGKFLDGWRKHTPVHMANTKFEPPADGKAWVRLTIVRGRGFTAGLGGSKPENQHGVAFIQIFTKLNNGTGEADKLMDAASAIFRTQHFIRDGVTINFQAPEASPSGSGGTYWEAGIRCPFIAEKTFLTV